MRNIMTAFLSATLFGLGLAVSGMIDPAKVKGFLDITGQWDPSLAFVMGGALAVTALGFAWLRRKGKAVTGAPLQWPANTAIDARLIGGAALFGAGWGLAGFCPGPAIGSLVLGGRDVMVFVAAMWVSMWVTQRLLRRS